jgi:hypothetical protein
MTHAKVKLYMMLAFSPALGRSCKAQQIGNPVLEKGDLIATFKL